jgi:hypothetical protein
VNRREHLHGFDLDNHQVLDYQVRAESDVDPNRSVDYRDDLLADRSESTLVWMRKAASTISLAMAFSVIECP